MVYSKKRQGNDHRCVGSSLNAIESIYVDHELALSRPTRQKQRAACDSLKLLTFVLAS